MVIHSKWQPLYYEGKTYHLYDPLYDDAQCFALVKRFKLKSMFNSFGNWWSVTAQDANGLRIGSGIDRDLNRAVCECVASLAVAQMEGR